MCPDLKKFTPVRPLNHEDQNRCTLIKGPMCEMFGAGIFTEIRPVWVGDLETRPKNPRSLCLGPYITLYFLGARSKTKDVLDCYYIHLFGPKRFF
jgi:hypothetical protein